MKDVIYKGITIHCSHKDYRFYIAKIGVGFACKTLKEAKNIIKESL